MTCKFLYAAASGMAGREDARPEVTRKVTFSAPIVHVRHGSPSRRVLVIVANKAADHRTEGRNLAGLISRTRRRIGRVQKSPSSPGTPHARLGSHMRLTLPNPQKTSSSLENSTKSSVDARYCHRRQKPGGRPTESAATKINLPLLPQVA